VRYFVTRAPGVSTPPRVVSTTSAYGASPLLVSRASRSAVASFLQLEADRKVLERAHRQRPPVQLIYIKLSALRFIVKLVV